MLWVRHRIWQGRIWSVARDSKGWRDYNGGGMRDRTDITGGHYDHLHDCQGRHTASSSPATDHTPHKRRWQETLLPAALHIPDLWAAFPVTGRPKAIRDPTLAAPVTTRAHVTRMPTSAPRGMTGAIDKPAASSPT